MLRTHKWTSIDSSLCEAIRPKVVGRHAVMAVGYADLHQWFLVRNSWGSGWGIKGHFTIPYACLLDANLADDFWTIRVVA